MDSAKTNRIIITLVILLVMGGITTYLIYDQIKPQSPTRVEVPVQNSQQQAPGRKERPVRAPEALPQLDLRKLDGTPLNLADYAGKTVLLNIWSANFAQSIEEMRNLRPIYDKFLTDSRIVMIGLSAEQDVEALKQFAAENSINWLQGIAAPNASAATKEFLANPGLIILGKDGSIIERPQDWWEAFCLLSEIVQRIKPAKPPELAIDFEQLPNQPKSFVFKRIASPSASDAGTQATISVIDGRQHGLSGPASILNDGKMPQTWDSPADNFFFIAKSIEGRFVFDLQQSIAIKAVNSYTWHAHERSPQVFRLYGADGAAANFVADPKFGVDPAKVGWTLIADVDTRPAPWPRGITGISIHQKDVAKTLGTFRYLLFVAFPTETHDAQGHTFFGEIDVISAN